MHVLSKPIIKAFIELHPESAEAFSTWYAVVAAMEWNNFQDIKQTYNSVDLIGDNHYVFNVGGNNYRVIALVFFPGKRFYIRGIYTHREYDRLTRKQILAM